MWTYLQISIIFNVRLTILPRVSIHVSVRRTLLSHCYGLRNTHSLRCDEQTEGEYEVSVVCAMYVHRRTAEIQFCNEHPIHTAVKLYSIFKSPDVIKQKKRKENVFLVNLSTSSTRNTCNKNWYEKMKKSEVNETSECSCFSFCRWMIVAAASGAVNVLLLPSLYIIECCCHSVCRQRAFELKFLLLFFSLFQCGAHMYVRCPFYRTSYSFLIPTHTHTLAISIRLCLSADHFHFCSFFVSDSAAQNEPKRAHQQLTMQRPSNHCSINN